MKTWSWLACSLALLGLMSTPAAPAQADAGDPPGRAARLSALQGSVSFEPAGLEEWTVASLNRPLTTGDRLWSDAASRAELDVGALVVRLGSTTGFSFLNLDDNSAQMQLTAGTLIVRVRDMRGGENLEIDTPNLAVTLQQPGEYRVEVNEAGDTTVVKVSEGQAQANGGGQLLFVTTQQRYVFSGSGQISVDAGTLGMPDELDAWSAARERQLEDSPSREYVADDVAGTQDLDDNGQWQETPEYGYVWTPTVVAVGWAPYRFGHWAWIGPWGWTWVDDARWGYAPFHYGRWVSRNNAWCWVPGPRNVRPVYAPALVGWVGGPAGSPLTVTGASVGWFPLGPRESYVPAYRVSSAYLRGVNVANTNIINDARITYPGDRGQTNTRYLNNTSAAVTAVPQEVFLSGQRLAGHTQHLPPAFLAGAAVGAGAPALVPSRASVLGPGQPRSVVRPPPALMSRPVLAQTPLPRAPVPFDRQVTAMEANNGRPLDRADLARLQPAAAAVPVRMVVAPTPARTPGGSLAPVAAASPGPTGSLLPQPTHASLRNDRPAVTTTSPDHDADLQQPRAATPANAPNPSRQQERAPQPAIAPPVHQAATPVAAPHPQAAHTAAPPAPAPPPRPTPPQPHDSFSNH